MKLSIDDSKRNKSTLIPDAFRYMRNQILNTTVYWKYENPTW
ncbi:unnamed protein product, partial [Rotaria sp. Silwood1]